MNKTPIIIIKPEIVETIELLKTIGNSPNNIEPNPNNPIMICEIDRVKTGCTGLIGTLFTFVPQLVQNFLPGFKSWLQFEHLFIPYSFVN